MLIGDYLRKMMNVCTEKNAGTKIIRVFFSLVLITTTVQMKARTKTDVQRSIFTIKAKK